MVRPYPDGFSKGLGLPLMPAVDTCLTSALPQPSSLTRQCDILPSELLALYPVELRLSIIERGPTIARADAEVNRGVFADFRDEGPSMKEDN